MAKNESLIVRVEVWQSVNAMARATILLDMDGGGSIENCEGFIAMYDMEHNDAAQRRVLGEQCRNAFEAGQCIVTYPKHGV